MLSSSASVFGVDNTGFPPAVISALICPSPGVAISSAITLTGYSPSASGNLRTRECPRPIEKPLPVPFWPRVVGPPAAGIVNITPPSRSRLPVMVFTTSTNQLAVVPKLTVHVPMRPYTSALSAAANSRAMRLMVSASIPTACATADAVNCFSAAGNTSSPAICGRM